MDEFRRCSIRLAIRVSVECISPSLAEQWRHQCVIIGEEHRTTSCVQGGGGGAYLRGSTFILRKLLTRTGKFNDRDLRESVAP